MGVFIITGAPGAGKTTYVEQNAGENDLVVDLDKIASAIHGGDGLHREYGAVFDDAIAVRDTLYGQIKKGGKWDNAFVITTRNADQIAKDLKGEIVEINATIDECKTRIMNDKSRPDKERSMRIAEQWFHDRQDKPHGGAMPEKNAKAEETKMETVNQEQPERTFTQTELNAIVEERLHREREKYAGYDDFKAKAEKYDEAAEAAKTDLQKAQEQAASYKAQLDAYQKEINTRNAREKVATETGIPANLLTGDNEEECKKQAEAILAWRGEQPKYPTVKDPGEPGRPSGGKTRDQFANWFNEKLK